MAGLTPQPRSVLLSLPYELRELILHHLLQSPNATAPSWANDIITTRNKVPTREHRYRSGSLTPWPPSPTLVADRFLYSASPALLTCHQLHNETRDLIHRHPDRYPYHLDLVIAPATTFTPTWLSLPAPPSFYNRDVGQGQGEGEVEGEEWNLLSLDVDFRLEILTDQELKYHGVPIWPPLRWTGNAGLADPTCMLLCMLGNWLEYGPRLCDRIPLESESTIEVSDLRMHFQVFRDGVENELTREAWVKACQPGDDFLWRERGMGREDSLHGHHYQLRCWLHQLAGSGLLFGRVGRIKLDVKGFEDMGCSTFGVMDAAEEVKRASALEWAGYGWLPGQKLRKKIRDQELGEEG